MRLFSIPLVMLAALSLLGCVSAPPKYNYSLLRSEAPRSVLVVPATNKSVDVNGPDFFLVTISQPLAERGYYVFPVNMVRSVLADDGLNDADLVHSADPRRLGEMFGADSVLYVSINRWDAKYVVISTTVTVELDYSLRSTRSGQELWKNHQILVYTPQASGAGGLVGLVADAITAAIAKAAPNYVPLAQQANALAIYSKGLGLPAGPHDSLYGKDGADF